MKKTMELAESALMSERARWRERGVNLPSPEQQVQDLIGQDFHYISFTSIEKLGLNPSTQYATPIGIYAYPTADPWFADAWRATMAQQYGGIPFAVKQPYIQAFEARSSSSVVVLSDDGSIIHGAGLVARAMAMLERQRENDVDWARRQIEVEDFEMRSELSELWLVTMLIARRDRYKDDTRTVKSLKYDNQHVALWTKLLLELGIEGVEDRGTGTIHRNEPHQAVFFRKNSVNHLGTIDNPLPAARAARTYLASAKGQLKVMRRMYTSLIKRVDSFLSKAGLEANTVSTTLGGLIGDASGRYSFESFVEEHGTASGINGNPDLDTVQAKLEALAPSLERLSIDYDRSAFVRYIMFNDKSSLSTNKMMGADELMKVNVGLGTVEGLRLTDPADFGRRLSGWSFHAKLNAIKIKDCVVDLRIVPEYAGPTFSGSPRIHIEFEGGERSELRVPADMVRLVPLFNQAGKVSEAAWSDRNASIAKAAMDLSAGSLRFAVGGVFVTAEEEPMFDEPPYSALKYTRLVLV